MPQYEYKVIKFQDTFFFAAADTSEIENELNRYARDGWRVVSTVTNDRKRIFAGNERHMEIVVFLERER